ncbi:AraC family transcriptional regulator, partial [Salmonella enterica]|nr:AraC family transcriptional regulator [Salmonella enterica]EAM3850379.1 AraC family transcriptional regulator [Salmonella enterica]EDR4442752.1 helix-turn-helix transcriptional regulator [Salmonella enterica subsp. enterica serovar Beaudesert]EGN7593479.1 helix-turn-helix transcriptional regulator [Salmonella enterica]EIZ8378295.1 helix-turn-helix transcriptional regulator [Salmonella enterica]
KKMNLTLNASLETTIHAGEIILIIPRENDYFLLSGSSDAVVFHAKILPRGLHHDLLMCQEQYNNIIIMRKDDSYFLPTATEMMKMLMRLKKDNVARGDVRIEIPVALFFSQLYIEKKQCMLIKSYESEHRLSGLILDIIKKPDYPWKVKEMAKQYNMSINCFINKFRSVSGFTPCNFLKKIRLNRGKVLLENTEIPVSLIASKCGYNSHSAFTFYITKEFGMSPVEIRKNQKIKNNKEVFVIGRDSISVPNSRSL